jgi:hypothetical protein
MTGLGSCADIAIVVPLLRRISPAKPGVVPMLVTFGAGRKPGLPTYNVDGDMPRLVVPKPEIECIKTNGPLERTVGGGSP